ncbi:MAG: PilZ domain-containing protein [Candidatus Omnitrophota bacterium]
MQWDGQERRKFPRAVFPCEIVVNHNSRIISAKTENIGRGGIRVFLNEELQYSAKVNLRLFIQDNQHLKCEGKIVWAIKKTSLSGSQNDKQYDTGVEFINMNDSYREYIKNLVERLLNKQDGFNGEKRTKCADGG